MQIDTTRVSTLGHRLGRLAEDAESYARTVSGPLRQATEANSGFAAIEALRRVLEFLGDRTGRLIKGTDETAGDVGTAAQSHAATEQRSKSILEELGRLLPQQTPGEELAGRGGETASGTPTPTPNPLRDVLDPGGQGGDTAPPPGDQDGQAPTVTTIPPVTDEPGSRERFIESVGTAAQAGQERFGVPASVASAQAILESGWGGSDLAQEANNYFGIKCSDGDPGSNADSCVNYDTWEVIDGNDTTVNDAFRAYESPSDSFLDHGQFLTENPRYAEAFDYSDDPDQFIREVADAGYATDPEYADKIIDIMQTYDLYRFDQ